MSNNSFEKRVLNQANFLLKKKSNNLSNINDIKRLCNKNKVSNRFICEEIIIKDRNKNNIGHKIKQIKITKKSEARYRHQIKQLSDILQSQIRKQPSYEEIANFIACIILYGKDEYNEERDKKMLLEREKQEREKQKRELEKKKINKTISENIEKNENIEKSKIVLKEIDKNEDYTWEDLV